LDKKEQLEGEERMLTMIQQHHIKYLYEYKGMSLRAIAKETGHSFQWCYVKKTDTLNREK